jgi:hypothetical protein
MSSIFERMAIKFPIQSMGMIQNSFMWRVIFPYIPLIGPAPELTFLSQDTKIPVIKKSSTTIRTQGGLEYTVPARTDLPHDWSLSLWMPEIDVYYTKLKLWYELQETFDIELLKTIVHVQLLSLNAKTITKIITLEGVYPTNIPGVEDLNMNSTTGLIKGDYSFSFDTII